MVRSLLWLVAGFVLFAAVVVISAPELVTRDLAGTGQLVLFAGIAGIPGVLVLVTVAARRRGDPGPDPDAPAPPDLRIEDRPADRDHTDPER